MQEWPGPFVEGPIVERVPEHFTATRDILGWNGERVLAGMTAPVTDWPDDYVASLVAEGTLRIEGPAVASQTPVLGVVQEAAGEAVRPPQGGDEA